MYNEHGGGGWHITSKTGTALLSDSKATGRWTSSYKSEAEACLAGLRDLRLLLTHPQSARPHLQHVLNCLGSASCLGATTGITAHCLTDSQSLLRRLMRGPIAQRG